MQGFMCPLVWVVPIMPYNAIPCCTMLYRVDEILPRCDLSADGMPKTLISWKLASNYINEVQKIR